MYDKEGDLPSAGEGPTIEDRVEVAVVPALYGGERFCGSGILDIDPALAERSSLLYRASNFPAQPGLKELLESILVVEGVPAEIAALPWVESDYCVGCHSVAGAAGPWQFLRETASDMGLRMDSLVDERYSWTVATRAAATYLRGMRRRLGDWTLAIAAYNCGEGVVAASLPRDYHSFDQIDLPGETEQFIPRVSAATIAYRQLEPSTSSLSVVLVPPDMDLRVLAALIDVHPDTVVLLNRHYLKEITPSDGEGWEVVVPSRLAPSVFRTSWGLADGRRYPVSSGSGSWGVIASSLGVSEDALRSANPGVALSPGTRLQVPPSERTPVNEAYGGREDFIVYIVRTGDTLGGIGESVGVSSREVALWNDMSPDEVIYPGQRLVLRTRGDTDAQVQPADSAPEIVTGGGRLEHEVREGDTLWDISLRYGVTVEQIM